MRMRKAGAWLLFWLLAIYPAVYYVVFPSPRYRVPIEPIMTILCVFVITEAGNHPKVAGLVYIAAFAPDAGESVSSLIKDPPPGAPVPPIVPAGEGFLGLEKARFRESFAADVDADKAAFMADSQVPWGVAALEGAVTAPAWKSKPSWYLVATEDHMIPPPAQRLMSKRAGSTVVEVAASHSVYVSKAKAVADLIEQAAKTVNRSAR